MSNLLPQSCLRQFARSSLRTGAASARPASAFALPLRTQPFSTTSPTQSRKGSAPITIPPEVSLKFIDLPVVSVRGGAEEAPKVAIEVSGPLGKMTLKVPPFVNVEHDEALRKATLSVQDREIKHQRAMWGTMRSHLQNYVLGVSEGHICILSMVGVGYRATIESQATTVKSQFKGQKFVSLKVGYSHPIELPVPWGVKASTPQPTRILLESVNKEVVTQFAAEIREWRKPEPYKGKGIFINGETVRLKAKKIR
ncbi:mitochondrial 54S ribosomal protein uL6m [Aspergillus brunneoviolaceus CBS 621.78]|uniref:Large ribosomal subunit protein uL6m n=2 Tax=Aspergillus TaxID=5052 RepID=A0A8G1VYI7_9EURO|nr:putative mitochondrial 54S ribosomal protein YmL16 [Aspergillus brunneoviolaceus CBS 621.78]XP_040801307.1 putative mitochondrial 54S ribosomal protein YmL16 [Aspergillus fijiensis CBS 313.89]RAH40830.1 putative mitochondrial 54S ribosomal protein YmL16 [Aspergillus brunneoviolaceus CBS 621.78]RAK77297.1 putative mitochondrial 54S ribosomal protein YmL16 [Aspergillus fijiensis CBS 313.89]